MVKRQLNIINRTKFKTRDIEEITLGLLAGQLAPSFRSRINTHTTT